MMFFKKEKNTENSRRKIEENKQNIHIDYDGKTKSIGNEK